VESAEPPLPEDAGLSDGDWRVESEEDDESEGDEESEEDEESEGDEEFEELSEDVDGLDEESVPLLEPVSLLALDELVPLDAVVSACIEPARAKTPAAAVPA
jgi:hypothetical protein